jgi:hypothetical protein
MKRGNTGNNRRCAACAAQQWPVSRQKIGNAG